MPFEPPLSTLTAPRQNYWLVRHFAALCVMFAHSFELSGKLPYELLRAFPLLIGISGLGVTVFFIVSGYLVTQSWERHHSITVFVWHRLLRIMPGLWSCMAFALLLGAAVTTLPMDAYWFHPQIGNYVWGNVLMRNVLDLPGVFQGNPAGAGITGTFWTLPIELTCYLSVVVLGVLGVWRNTTIGVAVGIAALMAVTWWGSAVNLFGAVILADKLPIYYAAFLCGMLLFHWRSKIFVGWTLPATLLALATAALWYLPPENLWWRWMSLIRVALLAWFLVNAIAAISQIWPEPSGWPDLSYGVYLYGYPIQQALVFFYPDWNGWMVLAASLSLSVAAAVVSWYAVEAPALRLKRCFVPRFKHRF